MKTEFHIGDFQCKHCGSWHTVRNGTYNTKTTGKRQEVLCRKCNQFSVYLYQHKGTDPAERDEHQGSGTQPATS